MKKFCLLMGLVMLTGVVRPAQAGAESAVRVIVSAVAPVFVQPDNKMTPLRVAKEGSILILEADEGDYYRVSFNDPQWGRRVGYIEKRYARVQVTYPQQAVDLTVAPARSDARPASTPQAQDLPVTRAPRATSTFPAWETSAAWSLLQTTRSIPLGWTASVSGSVTPWMSVVGEAGGNYTSLNVEGTKLIGSDAHPFLGGSRFIGRFANGRVNPFGQMLAGVTRVSVGGGVFEDWFGVSGSGYFFTMQPGGGIDIGLSDAVALRMQVDVRTVFIDGGHGTSFRFAPGIVIRTGSKN
jgi:hypothetical protein